MYGSVSRGDGQQQPLSQPVFNVNAAAGGTQHTAGAADNGGNQGGGYAGEQQGNTGGGQETAQTEGNSQTQVAGDESDGSEDPPVDRQPGAYNAQWQHWW
jgi:hypothetical protein